jgi:Sec-independent protein translocase protein TatA
MPIEGIEWVMVIGVVLVMILWNPEKIPEIARALGRFMNEIQKARMEADRYVKELIKPGVEAVDIADRQLIEAARKLNIVTEGLRKEEIVSLINEKLGGAASS